MPDPMMPEMGMEQPDMGMQQPMQQDPMQQMQQPPMEEEQPDQEDMMDNLVDFALSEINLAKRLKNKKMKDSGTNLLDYMGMKVVEGYEQDEDSRKEWMERNKEWMKLALMVREEKTFPWPKASNVKYPLLATAAMQYSARAYPSLVPADGQVVKAKAIPYDPDGKITDKASRIAKHMSHQVMNIMPEWEQDMDKLLITHAISGICFKKTYYSSVKKCNHSHIVYPEYLAVNYWARSLEKAYRKTELLFYNENEVKEKQLNNEEFLDIDLPVPTSISDPKKELKQKLGHEVPSTADKSSPHLFLAQHTFWDLDNDGYEEPYIITVHKDSKKVVRIIPRWESDGVYKDGNKIIKIDPLEYFTAFPFIPNPDGSIYAIGFGLLLGSLNESANSIINQLIDAGTLNNLQSGFIGKGLRLKMGDNPLRPGEFRAVNATGDDLHKQIVPLPTKEPSAVLMNLLNMLITSGNQLASIAEIFVGKMPGQNTPATTTQEAVKQGMAVFTAIYKRVYRSLASEFKKVYRWNRIIPDMVEEESKAIGIQLQQSDYDDENIIIPGGDPAGDSESTKQQKIDAVGQMLSLGTINPQSFTAWALQAKEIPNWQQLLAQPQPPQPDPTEVAKQETEKIKQQGMQQKMQLDAQLQQMKIEAEKIQMQLDAMKMQMELEHEKTKQAMEMQGEQAKMQMNMVSMANEQRMKSQAQQQDLVHRASMHSQELQAAKQKANAKPNGKGK